MHALKKICQMLEDELETLSKENMSIGLLEQIHKITDTIKNIKKIEMLDQAGDEYSERGSYGDLRGSYGNSYTRDSRGRYARETYSERRYSRAEAKDTLMDKLEDMMNTAQNERERQAYERCMHELQNS